MKEIKIKMLNLLFCKFQLVKPYLLTNILISYVSYMETSNLAIVCDIQSVSGSG